MNYLKLIINVVYPEKDLKKNAFPRSLNLSYAFEQLRYSSKNSTELDC